MAAGFTLMQMRATLAELEAMGVVRNQPITNQPLRGDV
jgi:hypothetical protein